MADDEMKIGDPSDYAKKLDKIFGGMPNAQHPWHNKIGFGVSWVRSGIGFGEFTFAIDNDKVKVWTETMGKDFVKEVLCAMVDDAEMME